MTGQATASPSPIPTEIRQRRKLRVLELVYANGGDNEGHERYALSYEFLRVFTPSAEARGHAPGQETLQTGKREVDIVRVEPVGHYAIRPVFSDGHDSGIYSWDILHFFCQHADALWQGYLEKLAEQGGSREVDEKAETDTKTEAKNAPKMSCGGRCGKHRDH